MLDDLLAQSPYLQEIEQRAEAKGVVIGEAKGEAKGLKEAILTFVQFRFPALAAVAQQQLNVIEDLAVLRPLAATIYVQATEEDARHCVFMAAHSKSDV